MSFQFKYVLRQINPNVLNTISKIANCLLQTNINYRMPTNPLRQSGSYLWNDPHLTAFISYTNTFITQR